MLLTINQTSSWITAKALKPFLLVGVASISSVALYTPISSQAKDLKDKLNKATDPLSPFTNKLLSGSQNLFEKLGEWAKTGANTSEKVKKWIAIIAKGNLSNGTRHIISNLKDWGSKVYEFLKTLLDKEIWEKFKKQAPLIKNILNLFKNIMKAEINGNTSIFNAVIKAAGQEGFEEFVTTFGDMATKNPEVFEQMNDQDVENLAQALKENPQKTTEIMKKLTEEEGGIKNKDQLMNAIEPDALIGKIKDALGKAKKFKGKDSLSDEEKKEAKTLFDELKELSSKLTSLIQKASSKK